MAPDDESFKFPLSEISIFQGKEIRGRPCWLFNPWEALAHFEPSVCSEVTDSVVRNGSHLRL